MPDHFAVPDASIDAGEMFFQATFQQWPMRNVAEIFGDEPDVFLRGHPGAAIELDEVHRLRVTPQSSFAAQVEVNVEITQRQLAQRPINRLAITAPGEIRFRERAPMPAQFENREDMVGILIRLEIDKERRKSENAQRGGRANRALQAMSCFFAQDFSRRPRRSGKMIRNGIEESLNAGRRF